MPPPARAGEHEDPYKYKYIIAIAVTLAAMLELIDTSIVNVAIPHMMGNLGDARRDLVGVHRLHHRQRDRHSDVGLVVGLLRAQALSHRIDRVTAVTLAVLALLSIVVKNFWCRYLCPYGALLGLVSWISPSGSCGTH